MTVFAGDDVTCLRGERLVFADLDFSVEAGGALVLLGPNGSGKSSLLRLMAGLLRPFSGALRWDQKDIAVDREEHGARLHYVGHLDAVKPVLTVTENLTYWAGLRSAAAHDGISTALSQFDLDGLAELPAKLLSAGQRRRLALARLAAAPAPLWLLDEPTVALDRANVARLTAAVATHREAGGMVVLSTHGELNMPGAETLELDRFTPLADPDLAI